MKKFWGYISNEKFSVGCTERTVYLYDAAGKELARFEDIKYGCKAVFYPNGDIFVVKSTGAYFAVYSAENAALIKTVKFSNVDGSQDDGFCFSAGFLNLLYDFFCFSSRAIIINDYSCTLSG